MKISEISLQTNIPASTIRYYEAQGILPPINKVSGVRVYRQEHIHLLNLIRDSQKLGFSLKEIKSFLNNSGADIKQMALTKLRETEKEILKLQNNKNLIENFLKGPCSQMSQRHFLGSKKDKLNLNKLL